MDAYNREKDRVTIEQTFDDLLKLVESLDEEEKRAVREGLNEESLALFDLLVKPELEKRTIDRIKKVATELLQEIRRELEQLEDWRSKQATRDAVRTSIYNFLYDEETGLPVGSYTEDEVEAATERVYIHVFRVYDCATPSIYERAA